MGRLLATDLDGTFIGDDGATRSLWRDLDHAGIYVVFATGRHLSSIYDFYQHLDTSRRARACVAMVGTEIWHRAGDRYELDETWRRRLLRDWRVSEVRRVAGAVPNVTPQPDEWQSPFKCSYYAEGDLAATAAELRHALEHNGLGANVIASAGTLLDVLPTGAEKGSAVRYVADSTAVVPEEVVTAGDTGNDLAMMQPALGFRSIVVGNATDRLRALEGPHVYQAAAPFAAGIREGLEHFGWL